MVVFGKRFVDFINPKGEIIKGVRLFIGEEIPLDKGEGFALDSQFISASHPTYCDVVSIPINSSVDIVYDKYGKVDKVIRKEI